MSEDIWAEFDDWNEEAFQAADGAKRNQIVKNNIALLLKRDDWHAKVEAFEAALDIIIDIDERKEKRIEYCIHFDHHQFSSSSHEHQKFQNYRFPCSTSFKGVKFTQTAVLFDGAKFPFGDVNFSNATFGRSEGNNANISFQNAVFGEGNISFESAVFASGEVKFQMTNFGDGNVSFHSTQFGEGKVSFRFAQFGAGLVNFSQAKFGDVFLEMSPLRLNYETKFRAINMSVEGSLYLRATFSMNANFCGLKVTKTTNLSRSIFQKCPNFLDTAFGRPPEVAGIRVPPPEMKGGFFKTCPDGDAAPKYRKLKSMALAANDHDKDGEFFAYEMMAKRGHEITGFGELLANSFYYHVSYYGQSWIRPLFGVFISWFVFTLIYLKHVATILTVDSLNFSAVYSALNSFPFLSSLHRLTLKPKDYEGSLEKTLDTLATHDGVLDSILNWAMFQQFIGIVLLFFLLLGLRNRFRLK